MMNVCLRVLLVVFAVIVAVIGLVAQPRPRAEGSRLVVRLLCDLGLVGLFPGDCRVGRGVRSRTRSVPPFAGSATAMPWMSTATHCLQPTFPRLTYL